MLQRANCSHKSRKTEYLSETSRKNTKFTFGPQGGWLSTIFPLTLVANSLLSFYDLKRPIRNCSSYLYIITHQITHKHLVFFPEQLRLVLSWKLRRPLQHHSFGTFPYCENCCFWRTLYKFVFEGRSMSIAIQGMVKPTEFFLCLHFVPLDWSDTVTAWPAWAKSNP